MKPPGPLSPIILPVRSPIVRAGGDLPWEGNSPAPSGAVDPILALAPYAWWRADDVTLSGSDATVIADRSGNGRTMTAVNAAQQIDGALGQKALDVVATSSEHYQAGDVGDPGSGDLTVISVVKYDASGGWVVSKRAVGDGWGLFTPNTTTAQTIADGTTTASQANGTINLTDPFYVRSRILAGVSITTLVDGTGTPVSVDVGAINNAVNLTLFARGDGTTQFWDGQWYETLYFLRDLDAGELSTILDYLNTRYSLAKAGV